MARGAAARAVGPPRREHGGWCRAKHACVAPARVGAAHGAPFHFPTRGSTGPHAAACRSANAVQERLIIWKCTGVNILLRLEPLLAFPRTRVPCRTQSTSWTNRAREVHGGWCQPLTMNTRVSSSVWEESENGGGGATFGGAARTWQEQQGDAAGVAFDGRGSTRPGAPNTMAEDEVSSTYVFSS